MGIIPCFVSELCTQLQLSNTFAYIVNQYKTCITMDMLSNLQQQRIMVDQLRREAAIKRINVSQAIEDIKKFISDHENGDYLLVGFPSQKSNPFREKSSCSVL